MPQPGGQRCRGRGARDGKLSRTAAPGLATVQPNGHEQTVIRIGKYAFEGISAFLPVRINGIGTELLVDTGAAVTVISSALFSSIPTEERPELKPPCDRVKLQTANNELIPVQGIATMDITIGDQSFKWDAFIAPISDAGILGYDFLYHFDCTLEARRGIRIAGNWFQWNVKGAPTRTLKVSLKKNIIIPACSEWVAEGEADVHHLKSTFAIVQPPARDNVSNGLVIGRSLIDPSRKDIGVPVRLMNTSSENIKLYAGATLGYLHEADAIELIAEEENGEIDHLHRVMRACRLHPCKASRAVSSHVPAAPHPPTTSKWPDGLQQLYDRSCEDLSPQEQGSLRELLARHENAFAKSAEDLGRTSVVQHTIDTGDARPIRQPPRRPPKAFQGEEEQVLDNQLKAGVIKESTSPWASPMVFVRKKDGTTRPCVDYRKLNDVTRRDAYPLPRVDDCLDCLSGAKIFSTLDLQSGYWQIEVKEEDRPKTAFVTRGGLYEYVTMPFGLCNAPSTFERCMELVLKGLQWRTLLIYLDDIIILSSTFSEHIERLDEVLRRLGNAGLKLKPSKCELFRKEVLFLGHIITQDGVKPDPSKVSAVQNWPIPKNITDVRSFLGLCSYYRRFVPRFATIASPLNRLLEAGQAFKWTPDCHEAFEKLKAALTSDNVMSYPDDDGLFILDTDASDSGIGATLSQLQWCDRTQKEEERPIAYASRSMTKPQRRYCTTRRELLAIVTFLQHFRHYLLGRQFLVRTDHSALRWVMSFREPVDQMARWLQILSQFDFKIEHRPGKRHGNADALSRVPCDPEDCPCYDGTTILADLPCGGCEKCIAKSEMWSDFSKVDDVVPLSTKRVNATAPEVQPPIGTSLADDEIPNSDITPQATPVSPRTVLALMATMVTLLLGTVCSLGKLIWRPCNKLTGDCKETHLTSSSKPAASPPGETPGQATLSTAIRVLRPPKAKRTTPANKSSYSAGRDLNCNAPCVPDKDANAGSNAGQQVIAESNPTGQQHDQDGEDTSDRNSLAADVGSRAGRAASWVGGYTSEEMSKLQRADPDLRIILELLTESSQRPSRDRIARESPATRNLWLLWQQLVLKDGVLFKRWETPDGTRSHLQLVVPQELQSAVLQATHDAVTSAHLGVKKTTEKTKRQFYWYRLKETVRDWIRKCAKCGARKRPHTTPRAHLQDYRVGAPMDRLVTDILGPLPISENGNKYILLVGDQFTKWMEAYPIPDQRAETVAHKIVYEYISRFGPPLDIHSDQGRTYESELMQQVCRLLEIHKTRTSPYHPSSNGQAERFNQVLVDMISAYVDSDQRNWDRHLPLLTSAYRSCQHEATGYSPNMLMLGRETHLPIALALGSTTEDTPQDECEYVMSLRKRMESVHHLVREHLYKTAERQKKDHDPRVSQRTYKIGDLVYMRDTTRTPGLSPKLKQAKWIGPCIILRTLSDLLFEVRLKQRGKTKVLHHDRLKPYLSNEVPKWMKELQRTLLHNGPLHKDSNSTGSHGKDQKTPRTVITDPLLSPPTAVRVPPVPAVVLPTSGTSPLPERRSNRTKRRPVTLKDFF